jgi:hypothetical protein
MPKKFKFGSDDNNKGLLIGLTVVVIIAVIVYFVFFKKENNIYYDVSVLIANIYFIYALKMISLLNPNAAERTKALTLCDNFIRSRLKSQGYTFQEITIQGGTGSNQINISRQHFINIKKESVLLFDNNDNFLDNNGKIVKAKPQTRDIDVSNITFLNSDNKEIFIISMDYYTFDAASFSSSTEIKMINLPKIKFI